MSKELLNKAIEILDKNGIKMDISIGHEEHNWFLGSIHLSRKKEEPKPEQNYRIGQRFMRGDCNYLLTICESNESDDGEAAYVALININYNDMHNCGKHYCPSIKVNDYGKITQEEFDAICGGNQDRFTLIDDDD